MRLVGEGVLIAGEPGTRRACYTFPSVLPLQDGSLLATARRGAGKDGDDDEVVLLASEAEGTGWTVFADFPAPPAIAGQSGTLKLVYLTELAPGSLLAAAMWVDRTSFPGRPLFNPKTEGCLPMAILLSRSDDGGLNWTPWRHVELPEDLGPPSLTSSIVRLADGGLLMSIETNKTYLDDGVWHQRAVMLRSEDDGKSWQAPITSAEDASGRIFNWDLRVAAAPDGRLVSLAWTYDREAGAYRNIHRRISDDAGLSWGAATDIGVTDQPGRPAVLPDGRLVLAWVDRFGTRSIRARMASIDAPFSPDSEVVLYDPSSAAPSASGASTLSGTLSDMELWSFGLPFATALPNGEVMVVFYAGTSAQMDIRWARLAI